MSKYVIEFIGRPIGASGITWTHIKTVEADTEGSAILALYETHENIAVQKINGAFYVNPARYTKPVVITKIEGPKMKTTVTLAAVAAILNAEFISSNYADNDAGEFIMPNGVKFHAIVGKAGAYYGVDPDKIKISSSFPKHVVNDHGGTHVTIQRDFLEPKDYVADVKISAFKTAEQVAKDIQRRFLPGYEAIYPRAVAWCKAQADYYTGRKALQDLVKELMPYKSGKVNASVEYAGETYVNLRIDGVNEEHIRKIAALLEEINK